MSEHTALQQAAVEGEAVVERVIALWNGAGRGGVRSSHAGWIPGAGYKELAEALGVSPDRLVHWDQEKREHYYPEGVE